MDIKAYKHEWYLKNKERCKENNKRYRKEHLEKTKEQGRIYYQKHRDDKIAYSKKWKKAHADHVAEYNKAYKEAHKEYLAAYMRDRTRKKYGLKPFHVRKYLEEHSKNDKEVRGPSRGRKL